MKKLTSLNNSLFEKFESKKIENIATILGGNEASNWVNTQCSTGTDEFDYGGGQGGTNDVKMYVKNNWYLGDICYN